MGKQCLPSILTADNLFITQLCLHGDYRYKPKVGHSHKRFTKLMVGCGLVSMTNFYLDRIRHSRCHLVYHSVCHSVCHLVYHSVYHLVYPVHAGLNAKASRVCLVDSSICSNSDRSAYYGSAYPFLALKC